MNIGGTSTWINNLDSELQKLECQVGLIYGETISPEVESEIVSHDYVMKINGLGKGSGLLSSLIAFFKVRRIIKELKPQIINTHTSKGGFIGRLANLSLGSKRSKVVHTFHGHVFTGYFPKFISQFFALVERTLALLTDLILVSGANVNLELSHRKIGKESQRIIVFPGITYHPRARVKNTTPYKFRIGWLGRLAPIKRPDRVVLLAIQFPQVQFQIAGNGELLSQLKKSAPNNLIFEGWSDPQDFWSKVDLALLTSDNEAMPYSLIEAGMQGLPSITTDAGSTSEVVINKKTGLVVEKSIKSLSEAIQKFLNNPELMSTYGYAAQEWTNERFNVRNMALAHLEAYKRVI